MFELSRSASVRIAPLVKSTARVVITVVRLIRTMVPLVGAVDKEMVLDDAKVNDVDVPPTKTVTSACRV